MTAAKKISLFVPGRLCLFGEHSDWAGQMRKFNAEIMPGRALVVCTEEGIYADAEASDELEITSPDSDGNIIKARYEMNKEQLRAAASEGGFFSYVAGVALYMLDYYQVGGLKLNCTKMTLPQKKGLSSSAAICTLTARAFNQIYDLSLTLRGEMEAAYGGEQLTPSRCGRLDQAVAFGRGIVDMRFDGDKLDVAPVKTGAPLHFIFADLNASKDTITILRDLNSAYPFTRRVEHNDLHKLLGPVNTEIVSQATQAIMQGDAQRIGELMTLAQENFDRYAAPMSAKELEAPVLHRILNDGMVKTLTYGGKGVGSQGDGSVQFIAKSAGDAAALKEYLQNAIGLQTSSITVPKSSSVRKAVIPLGGYGTRMFPATKVVHKEFLPVTDTDGYTKPMLLILLEALAESGIEEICLVIRPGEEEKYRQLFDTLPDEIADRLPSNLIRYNEEIIELGHKITYAYQNQPLGFGHAVLQSAGFAGDDPVILLLGDHLFTSNTQVSCITQLIEAYEQAKSLTTGLFELPENEVGSYGIASIEKDTGKIKEMKEKPAAGYAAENLKSNGKYYGVFMYVLTPGIFKILKKNFLSHNGEGELQLTPALDEAAKLYGAVGAVIDGKRFDAGLPQTYKRMAGEYGKSQQSAVSNEGPDTDEES